MMINAIRRNMVKFSGVIFSGMMIIVIITTSRDQCRLLSNSQWPRISLAAVLASGLLRRDKSDRNGWFLP